MNYLRFLKRNNEFSYFKTGGRHAFFNLQTVCEIGHKSDADLDLMVIGEANLYVFVTRIRNEQISFGYVKESNGESDEFVFIGESFFDLMNSL